MQSNGVIPNFHVVKFFCPGCHFNSNKLASAPFISDAGSDTLSIASDQKILVAFEPRPITWIRLSNKIKKRKTIELNTNVTLSNLSVR